MDERKRKGMTVAAAIYAGIIMVACTFAPNFSISPTVLAAVSAVLIVLITTNLPNATDEDGPLTRLAEPGERSDDEPHFAMTDSDIRAKTGMSGMFPGRTPKREIEQRRQKSAKQRYIDGDIDELELENELEKELQE